MEILIGAAVGLVLAACFIWCVRGISSAQRSALYDDHDWSER